MRVMSSAAQRISIHVNDQQTVSGLVQGPGKPEACFVFAHGAGAGMEHGFMQAVADGLARRAVATLRFQFPYMESGSSRPDVPAVAHRAVRAAVSTASELFPDVPLFAGGKSFGARMTSQAQAKAPLPSVQGLVFLGFPLHPDGKPSIERAEHLDGVAVPMLFLQGTRDGLADIDLVTAVTTRLAALATLVKVAEADHSFHVLKRSGRSDEEVMEQLLDVAAGWMIALR
ncbi:alpha/beta hydrolase [soil metagenome]